jgi:hypothetical protein
MAYRAQVSNTPQQLAYGSQKENLTLTNVGANTVYLSNDSSVTPGSDLVLDVGGSILVEPGTIIYGVCAKNLDSQVSVVARVGERFAYAAQSYKVINQYKVSDLGPGLGSGNQQTGTITFDNTFSTQYEAIGIFVTSTVTSNISFQWAGSQGTAQYVMARSVTGSTNTVGGIFPIKSYGGTWTVIPESLVGASTITIVGYPIAPYSHPTVYNDPKSLNTSWNGLSGSWNLLFQTVAVNTTVNINLPALAPNVQIRFTGSLAGATPTFSIIPFCYRSYNSGVYSTTALQFDAGYSVSTAGGFVGSIKLTDVPPSPLYLQLQTNATGSVSALNFSIDQNK